MNKFFTIFSLVFCCYLANADDSQVIQPLSSGFYSNSQNTQKDSTLAKIQSNADESDITLLSITSRRMYVSDGYGIDEYGGQLNPPITFTYSAPQIYIASGETCTATLTQKSSTSFKISVNDANACFGEYGMFATSGAITKKMVAETFYLDASTANIQTLHGQ